MFVTYKYTFGSWFMAESLFKEFMRLRKNYKCKCIPVHMCSISKFIWGFPRKYQSEYEYELHLCNSPGYSVFILYFSLLFPICSTVSISLLVFTLNGKTSFETSDQRYFIFNLRRAVFYLEADWACYLIHWTRNIMCLQYMDTV